MKFVITFAALLCAFCVFTGTKALPAVSLENALDVTAAGDTVEQGPGQLATVPSRQKRATCDLLSGTGLNHSACAAHCVLRGNRGGYCSSKAVCTCRN